MRILKPETMSMFPRVTRLGRQGRACVFSAFCCFSIAEDDEHSLRDEGRMWQMLPEALGETAVFDEGFAKPRGEFLVYGRCHPPPGDTDCKGLEIRISVGPVTKRLQVFGERHFDGKKPMPPRPLEPFPLDWTYAYGGPECPENPLGLGHGELTAGSSLPRVLAASDHEDDLQHASPAGLVACPSQWPQRTRHLGAFDRKWLLEDWPELPAGTNREFRCTAPEDQRLNSHFVGAEALEVVGMHPARPVLQSSLPGLMVRMFIRRQGREELEEVPCSADTLWIFPEQELAVLCFRGQAEIQDDEATDIEAFVGGWEELQAAALPASHYLELLRREEPEEAEPDEQQASEVDVPQDAGKSAGTMSQAEHSQQEIQPPPQPYDLGRLQEIARSLEAAANEQLQQAGLSLQDVEAMLARSADTGEPLQHVDLESFAANMEQEAQKLLAERGLVAEDVTQLLQKAAATAQQQDLGAWYDAVAARPEATPEMRQAAAEGRQALDEFQRAMADFETLVPGPPAMGTSPELAKETEASTSVAPTQEPTADGQPEEPTTPAHLDFRGQDLRKADFSGKDLDGADFSGANLAGANFSHALLRKAIFREAKCLGADFEGCIAQEAVFTNADLQHCHFLQADLSGADLNAAQMDGADISFALLHEVEMQMASARECTGLHAEFNASLLRGTDFTGSVLSSADFSDCDMDGAALRESLLDKAVFYGAKARGTLMRDTGLHGSRANEQTDFSQADFRLADLTGARWQGAVCSSANFWGALLDGASMEMTRLDGSILKTVSARNATFDKADLQGANLRHSNLFAASLRKTLLHNARLGDTNLYAADLLGAHMDATALENVNIRRTLLDTGKFHG